MSFENPNPKNLIMVIGSCYKPKHNPSKPKGEDAHFICEEAQVIGVADGVGGWAKIGIDAGNYARTLMKNAEKSVRTASSAAALDPMEILETAYSATAELGTSTACIMRVDGGVLRAANLGDSGFVVIRGGDAVCMSRPQQRGFNHPYQLGTSSRCGPGDAEEVAVELESGDVVVAGTDGLFDNMFLEDIEVAVRGCLEEGMVPARSARVLAERACRNSKDKGFCSPFEVAACEAGGKYSGGKYDDITVVVGYVVELRLEGFEVS